MIGKMSYLVLNANAKGRKMVKEAYDAKAVGANIVNSSAMFSVLPALFFAHFYVFFPHFDLILAHILSDK